MYLKGIYSRTVKKIKPSASGNKDSSLFERLISERNIQRLLGGISGLCPMLCVILMLSILTCSACQKTEDSPIREEDTSISKINTSLESSKSSKSSIPADTNNPSSDSATEQDTPVQSSVISDVSDTGNSEQASIEESRNEKSKLAKSIQASELKTSRQTSKSRKNKAGNTEDSDKTMVDRLAEGEKLYRTHCASCHPGGGNLVKPSRPVKGANQLLTYATFKAYLELPIGDMPHYERLISNDELLSALHEYCKSL